MKGRLPTALLAGLLCACASEDMAGRGVAGETTNGIRVRGTVRDSAGGALAGAKVHLVEPLTALALDSGIADGNGDWELGAPTVGRFVVAARKDSVSVLQWVSLGAGTQSAVPMTAATGRRVAGTISGGITPEGLTVSLPSLGLTGTVNPDSSWSVPGVPAGWHLVRISDASGILGEGMVPTWKPVPVRLSRDARTLLDDFDGDEGQGRLTPLLDGAWWGRWNDTSALLDSARTWAGTPGLATDSSAYLGRSLRVRMKVGAPLAADPTRVRSAGLVLKVGGREDLDSASVWHPLERIDSVVFVCKGTGTVEFQLKARDASTHVMGLFRKRIVLDSAWTRVALAPGDFQVPAGLGWGTAQLRELYWVSGADAELWLDEVELTGVRPTELLVR